jgi:hypothetical protein
MATMSLLFECGFPPSLSPNETSLFPAKWEKKERKQFSADNQKALFIV